MVLSFLLKNLLHPCEVPYKKIFMYLIYGLKLLLKNLLHLCEVPYKKNKYF